MQIKVTENTALVEKMVAVGAHYGFTRTRRHPSIKPFLYATKDRADLIDLSKTGAQLESAKAFITSLVRGGKTVLFVGNKPEAQALVKEFALSARMPYCANRWIGGTLTNFGEIKKRIEKLHDLLDKKEKGEFAVYTKKERLLIDRSIEKMDENFGGLADMKQLPAAIILIDSLYEDTALKEALFMHIPVVSLSNTDCDVSEIEYPVVANDGSQASLKFFLNEFAQAVKEAKSEVK